MCQQDAWHRYTSGRDWHTATGCPIGAICGRDSFSRGRMHSYGLDPHVILAANHVCAYKRVHKNNTKEDEWNRTTSETQEANGFRGTRLVPHERMIFLVFLNGLEEKKTKRDKEPPSSSTSTITLCVCCRLDAVSCRVMSCNN